MFQLFYLTLTLSFAEKSDLYELKIKESFTLEFSRPTPVVTFCVHSNPDWAKETINALNMKEVKLGKKPKEIEFKSDIACPFTAESGSDTAIYRQFEDKTFGIVNAAVLNVDDQVLRIVPGMTTSSECKANGENIGSTEVVRQWKLVIIPLTDFEFEEIQGNNTTDPIAITYDQVNRRIFEERVQFMRETRDNRYVLENPKLFATFP